MKSFASLNIWLLITIATFTIPQVILVTFVFISGENLKRSQAIMLQILLRIKIKCESLECQDLVNILQSSRWWITFSFVDRKSYYSNGASTNEPSTLQSHRIRQDSDNLPHCRNCVVAYNLASIRKRIDRLRRWDLSSSVSFWSPNHDQLQWTIERP